MEKWYAICKEKGNSGWEVDDVVVFEKGSIHQMIPDEDNPISFTNKSFEDFVRESSAKWKKLDAISTSEMEKEMPKIESRELVKPCMIVKLRSGEFAKIEQIQGRMSLYILNQGHSWMNFNYDENLNFHDKMWQHWDIVEVYGFSDYGSREHINSIKYRPLIWKRKTENELEIERLQSEIKEREEKIKELKQ